MRLVTQLTKRAFAVATAALGDSLRVTCEILATPRESRTTYEQVSIKGLSPLTFETNIIIANGLLQPPSRKSNLRP